MVKKLKVFYVTLVLFGVFVLFRPPLDPDFGWHFTYGEYFVQTGTLLRDNIFSYTFPDYAWANSYWFAQALMYMPSYFLGNTLGIIVATLLLSVVLALIIVKITLAMEYSMLGSVMFAALTLLTLGSYQVTVRPLYFSTVFFFVLAYILLKAPKCVPLLPLIFLFWANMHADFTLGLFVFIVFVATKAMHSKKLPVAEALVLASSALATLINPFGLELHRTLLKETNPFQFKYIAEWTPITMHNMSYYVWFVLILTLLAVAVWGLRKQAPLWQLGVTVVFSVLAVRSTYFLRPALIFGVFLVVQYFAPLATDFIKVFVSADRAKISKVAHAVALMVFMTTAGFFVHNMYVASDLQRWSAQGKYPYASVQYIREHELEGNIFNSYVWGGYLVLTLPEKKTFIDGRMASWREGDRSIFEDYITMTSNSDDAAAVVLFEEYVRADDIHMVLGKPGSELIAHLKGQSNWRIAIENATEVLLVR